MKRDELVVRAKRGDESAWAELHEKYSARTEAVCFRIVRDVETARDLAQETFLLAWRKIKRFRETCAFSTWLHRIAYNVSLMWLRCKKNSMLVGNEEPYFGLVARRHTDSDLKLDLARAMSKLAPGYKRVFALHAIHRFEQPEIARMLGCSEGAVKSQYWKARQVLRAALV